MPRVEGERIQLLNGLTKNLWLGLKDTEVRRAEELSVIIKLRNTKCGRLPIYTTSGSGRL